MDHEHHVRRRIETFIEHDGTNLAITMLRSLSEHFKTPLDAELITAASSPPAEERTLGAQASLFKGALLFLELWEKNHRLSEGTPSITDTYAAAFKKRFAEFPCRERSPDGKPIISQCDICPFLVSEAILFTMEFIRKITPPAILREIDAAE